MAKQKLITKTIAKTIPPIYSTSEKETWAIRVPVKIFDSTGAYTFYVTEYDPDQRLLFGYQTGTGFDELGYQSLDELEQYRGKLGIGMERDQYWNTSTTLAEVKDDPVPKPQLADIFDGVKKPEVDQGVSPEEWDRKIKAEFRRKRRKGKAGRDRKKSRIKSRKYFTRRRGM